MTPLEKIPKAATGQKHLYSMDLGRVVLIEGRICLVMNLMVEIYKSLG